MKILVQIRLFCEPQDSREEQRGRILRGLQNEYRDTVCDKEAYLATDCCTEDDFIFGADAPGIIRKAAENWNSKIENRLHTCIDLFRCMPRATTLFDLEKAIMAANDGLHTFADEAVLIPEEKGSYYYMHSKLHADQYKQVVQNPADFAIVEVGTA